MDLYESLDRYETADDIDSEEAESALLASTIITDIYLVASSSRYPPPGPTGYDLVGYWDVDRGGALGTNGSTGSYMTAMYVRRMNPGQTSYCVQAVHLQASNNSWLPPTIAPFWLRRGYWDVDSGGAQGGNGTRGAYMAGLYIFTGAVANQHCLADVVVTGSSTSTGVMISGYDYVGRWDVDDGGGYGAFGTNGHYMMTLMTQRQ